MGRQFEGLTKERRDELLSAYLDDQLDADERVRLEAQLAADPGLQAEMEALRCTVALVRDLPPQPIPRNFILPQTAAPKPQRPPATRPRLHWVAPFLTAATAIASLFFVAVLAGDLLLSGVGGVAQLAAPASQAERVAVEPSPAEETASVEEAGNVLPVTESPERALAEASPEAAEVEETAIPEAKAPAAPPTPTASPQTKEGDRGYVEPTAEVAGSPVPPTGGGAAEAAGTPTPAAVPAPTAPPTSTAPSLAIEGHTPPPPAPPTVTTVAGEQKQNAERTPGEEVGEAPAAVTEEAVAERGKPGAPIRFDSFGMLPWRVLEIVLGVVVLALVPATVWAWRARRRR